MPRKATALTTLLKKQARIAGDAPDNDSFTPATRKKIPGRDPILWFASAQLPRNVTLGFYRSIFAYNSQAQDASALAKAVQAKQLKAKPPPADPRSKTDVDGGVPLPASMLADTSAGGPHYFLCMMGGGHFAAMIVSLTPSISRKHGVEDRSATVIAHKTFHRYTTRRKQGGAQSANDSAKGAAHSAGSSLRRYNETALTAEIRELLTEWKHWIDTSDLLFIRATGSANRRTLYGPYDGQILRVNDDRIRGFPFNTRRATQAELMRAFIELTRVKVHIVDEEAEAERAIQASIAAEQAAVKAAADARIAAQSAQDTQKRKEQEARDQEATLHTSQIQALIKRSKAPGLVNYIQTSNLSPDFNFFPPSAPAHHITPTPLHLAARSNLPVCVAALLTKTRADPTLKNQSGKTAYELASDRATRDTFRVARHELGESAWDWDDAKVAAPMTRDEADAIRAAEQAKLQAEQDRVAAEAAAAEAKRRETQSQTQTPDQDATKGKSLRAGIEKVKTAQDKRDEEMRGMTPEMRAKLERERRARAIEARLGLR